MSKIIGGTKGMGWIPDLPDHRDFPFKAARKEILALPPRASVRSGWPKVYDQGSLGSCTAMSVCALFDFVRKKQKAKFLSPSKLFTYYWARHRIDSVGYDSGAMIRDAIKSLVVEGVCRELNWPYIISKFKVKPSAALMRQAEKQQALDYFRINNKRLEDMKACLAAGYPFTIGISIYSNFPWDGKRTVPMPSGSDEGGHAIDIDEYDDSDRTFGWRNSWGVSFGNKGYGKIPYEYLTNLDLASDCWTLRLTEV